MEKGSVYIIISLIFLGVIAILLFVLPKKNDNRKLSTLAGLSFAFILAGLNFGDKRYIGYSLTGIGIVLAAIDMIIKWRRSRKKGTYL
jgi:heme/copper-type cytochrome/quinol oxidase subunit 1